MGDLVIARLDNALVMLSEAKTLQDTKQILDVASAAETYAKRQKLGEEAIGYAHSIKVEALRRLGEMLQETPRATGGEHGGKTKIDGTRLEPSNPTPTLEKLGLDKKTSSMAQKLAKLPPKHFEQVKQGHTAISQAIKVAENERRKGVVIEASKSAPDAGEQYKIFHTDCENADVTADWIITDPPYVKEALDCYDKLARVAKKTLKPGGSLLCMTGQSYLPQVMESLSAELQYHWTIAYLTPGGQAVQLFQRKVNTFWKPVLWFTNGAYGGEWIGDVTRSAPNDNDKRFHEWGQSESGMYDLMKRFVKPGDTVIDPFMGAGTTGLVSLSLGAKFIGYDTSDSAFNEAKVRLANAA